MCLGGYGWSCFRCLVDRQKRCSHINNSAPATTTLARVSRVPFFSQGTAPAVKDATFFLGDLVVALVVPQEFIKVDEEMHGRSRAS